MAELSATAATGGAALLCRWSPTGTAAQGLIDVAERGSQAEGEAEE